MSKPLRVLIAEDNEMDAALLMRELRRGGYEPNAEMVDTPEAMRTALERETWDIVLSDYSMPRFSAPAALSLVREQYPEVPFIIISGTVGEETAVESIRAGAQDFMVKGSLARLLPAIDRELRESAMRAERKAMREQLMISDRMASIGMLAATVAHEINNPLAVISANLEFMAINLAADFAKTRNASTGDLSDTETLLLGMQEAMERVRSVARDLKVFSHTGDDDVCRPIRIQAALESAIRMASNEIRHRARLVTEFEDVGPVHANEGRLGQVFLNLIVNAAQAMPEGRAGENEIRITTRAEGERVIVQVSDTGCGIAPEHLAKMFTPFFTTKSAGVGTGLGLMICQRIVKSFGGDIAVESEVGRGTVFRISLPRAKITEAEVKPLETAPCIARRCRVLIVDDQPTICDTLARMLGNEHDVATVTTAKAALTRIADGGERYDFILSDLMMPEMTGVDLHAALCRAAPDQAQKMIFMTGGAFSQEAAAFLRSRCNPTLEKPFKAAVLRQLLRDLSAPAKTPADIPLKP